MAASSTGKKIQGANRVYIEAHGRSYVSQKGVIAVLKSIREHGMPKHVSRSTLKRTRERELDSDTAYGPLFATIEVEAKQGGKKKIPVVAPLPLLANLVQAAPFALFLDNLMSEKVPTVSKKWRICLYCDEVLPGNALNPPMIASWLHFTGASWNMESSYTMNSCGCTFVPLERATSRI